METQNYLSKKLRSSSDSPKLSKIEFIEPDLVSVDFDTDKTKIALNSSNRYTLTQTKA